MKNKNDIRYIDFLSLWEFIKSVPEEEHESRVEELDEKTRQVFFGKSSPSEESLNELKLALETPSEELIHNSEIKIKGRKYLLDLNFDNFTWGKFVTVESQLKDNEIVDFIKEVLVPRKNWYQRIFNIEAKKIKDEDISLALYEEIISKYKLSSMELKEMHQFTFDPPFLPGKIKEETQGDIYRKEFSDYYGGYVELTYLVSNGNVLEWSKIENLPATEVLFKGEYLLRKNKVENIK